MRKLSDTKLRECMELAIEEATRCEGDDSTKVRPKVGAVVIDSDGQVHAKAHRGEVVNGKKGHAEYTALELKPCSRDLSNHTVFTTLEPCFKRSAQKTSCAQWLINRHVGHVVIGILDPNQNVRGQGIEALRKEGIAVSLFDPDLMEKIEELNRDYLNAHREPREARSLPKEIKFEFPDEMVRSGAVFWMRFVKEGLSSDDEDDGMHVKDYEDYELKKDSEGRFCTTVEVRWVMGFQFKLFAVCQTQSGFETCLDAVRNTPDYALGIQETLSYPGKIWLISRSGEHGRSVPFQQDGRDGLIINNFWKPPL